jgi:L-galactonate dehydratase
VRQFVLTGLDADLRFPTSLDQSGSDATNQDPDYSAAYTILHTNTELNGHGFSFTIGRGNDLVCSAAKLIAKRLIGKNLAELTANMGQTWRYLVSDSQVRWCGPEKGVVHLGLSACVNALWDMWAKYVEKPVWKLVADMTPEEFVRCIDFHYIVDAITPEEALEILKEAGKTKAERIADALNNEAVPAYTTEAGWLGYSDEKMTSLIKKSMGEGMMKFKLKVGTNIEDDKRRLKIARDVLGYDNLLMTDANQVWDVPEAIEKMIQLAEYRP